MTKTALITGASSGIGRELAKVHAAHQGDLIIVARRKEELESLKKELEAKYNIRVTIISIDLSKGDAPEKLFQATEDQNLTVDYLINNAGFGGHGEFYQQDLGKMTSMIDVNIRALTALTRLYLPGMISRNDGKILNVSSTAGFLPGPLQAVYYATKAYVNSFSQALAEELSKTNVTVTALCPGPVETEFLQVANMEGVELTKGDVATAADVAKIGYQAMLEGKLIKIDDPKLSFLINWVVPFVPRKLVLKLSHQTMKKRK